MNTSNEMKALYFNKHGDIYELQFGDFEKPVIKKGEVLVKTSYAALNRLDLFVLKGWPGLKLNMPHIPGADGSGIIEQIHPEDKERLDLIPDVNFKEGDSVVINPGISCMKCDQCLSGNQNFCRSFSIKGEHDNGTFSQYFNIPIENILKVPDDFSLKEAAASSLTFLTAWRMLVTLGNVKHSDFVFIQGGSGGVSIAAIQIAKLFNAKVITSTSSDEKAEILYKIGADYVINYSTEPDYLVKVYKEITKKRGIDIVIDSVGKATFSNSLKMLKPGGKLITCGATTGPNVSLNIAPVFWKQYQILGSTMANQEEFRNVMSLLFKRKLKPVINAEFSLENATEAYKAMNSKERIGKIVLNIEK